MNKTRQTVVAHEAPLDSNVIWIDISGDEPIQKVFLNGAWIPTSAAAGEYYTKDEVDENFMGKIDDPHVGNILVMDENGKAVDSTKKAADFISNPEGGQEHAVLSLDSHGNPVWTTITPTGTADTEMSDSSTNAVQNKVIKEYIDDNYARKDGYYSQMAVGSAENLVGQTVDSADYLIRPTGGAENEVANGVASVLGMEGNSCVWNQHVGINTFSITNMASSKGVTMAYSSGEYTIVIPQGYDSVGRNIAIGTITVPNGHKVFLRINSDTSLLGYRDVSNGNKFSSAIFTIDTSSSTDWYIRSANDLTEGTYHITINIIDLTLLGIDNLTTVADVETWLAQHVGTKPYYGYNAGTILSAQTLGIKNYGQNLLNPTTKQAKLIPYTWEENSNVYTIKNVPSGATATFTPDATGVAESITITNNEFDITNYGSGILELSAATADTYVCMKWDEQKDDDVLPFEEHTQTFDVRKVYGKVNGAGEYVQCYPNGLRGIGDIKDTLTAAEAVVKIDAVDLGDLSYSKSSSGLFRGELNPPTKQYIEAANAISPIFTCIPTGPISGPSGSNPSPDMVMALSNTTIYINYLSTTDVDVFKTAMSGVPLYYELATPITYTDLVYRDGGVDRPLANVLMNIEVNNWSMEEQLMTPYDENGNPTSIPATIKTQYGMDAVEEIDTLQKTCYFTDDVKANLQALLTCINTNCAETLGGTFSISDTATDKVFAFTFTPNTEPDVESTNEGE